VVLVIAGADVTERLEDVRAQIVAAGRSSEDVRVVAVTKGFGVDAVQAAVSAGLVDCGENQAQSMLAKVTGAPPEVRWHFLGPVQRNKVRDLAGHVHLWHALDRAVAGHAIAARAPGARVLVQVNLTGDPARPGCTWDGAAPLVDEVRDAGLDVRGLMGVGPRDDPRPAFRRLAALAARLGLPEVSMGMSGDLAVAIEEGATIVRIGTALFGARPGTAAVRR
jgi:pyridoxal phosphate enzyme (YggS family)